MSNKYSHEESVRKFYYQPGSHYCAIIAKDRISKDIITPVDLINSLQAILSNFMGCKIELSESMCEDIAKQFPNKSDKTIGSNKKRVTK